jgi:VanZ family protein
MLKWFEKHNKFSAVITLFGAISIFYISSLSFSGGAGGPSFIPTFYHFCAFFCLTFFLLISSVKGKEEYRIFLLAILISILYGFLDEVHQLFVPGRYFAFFDIFVDTLGVLAASMIYLVAIKYKKIYINSKVF